MKKSIITARLGSLILFATNLVYLATILVPGQNQRICCLCDQIMSPISIVGLLLVGCFFVKFLSLQKSYAMKAASICSVAAIGLFLAGGCLYYDITLIIASLDGCQGLPGWKEALGRYQSLVRDIYPKLALMSLLGSLLWGVFFISMKVFSVRKPFLGIVRTSTVGLVGSSLSAIWALSNAAWQFAVKPELLYKLDKGIITIDGYLLALKVANVMNFILGGATWLVLMVFFTMLLRHCREIDEESAFRKYEKAPRSGFWIAFVPMVVAACAALAIFSDNEFFETLKIDIKQYDPDDSSRGCVISLVDFSWLKFFILHTIVVACSTLAVAREYKMRLRDLNLSEKFFNLIFVVHLIPYVNIAACIVEAVFLGGQKGFVSGKDRPSSALGQEDTVGRLEKLESLKNSGLISDAEYAAHRAKILSEL